MKRISVLPLLFVLALVAQAQTLNVTFRYVPGPEGDFVRAYLPGDFNGWSITEARNQMTLVDSLEQYVYTYSFPVGTTTEYKINLHLNESGTTNIWLTDPLNDESNPADNNNSVLRVTNPMVFQLAREGNHTGSISAVSAGIFGTEDFTSITFEINGEERDGLPYYNPATGIFRYVLETPVPSGSQFKIAAVDFSGDVVADSVGLIPPQVVDAPRPAGIEDGVDLNGTIATFSLFAPGKNYVHLIGDFNDWTPSDEYLMYRDAPREDSVHWWIQVRLDPDREYAYQYLVDGELRLADPFATKILDPANDSRLSSGTYPNLKPYPTGKTTDIVSVFNTIPFMPRVIEPWPDRPPQDELVIYELLLRDFLAKHDFKTLIDTLAYLDRLGVNAIELMPVSEFSGNSSWGYNPTFPFAVDKYYGPAGDLRALVEAAHQRGMAVILDVVYNHQADESPLVRLYGGVEDNPFINVPARHDFNVFYDVDHTNSYIKYWLDRVNAYWLEEFNIDGYRFDLSKGFMQTGSFHDYNAQRVGLLKRMADRIWEVDSTAYVILEHFGALREENELMQYGTERGFPGMMVWAKETDHYNEATMGYHDGGKSNFSTVFHKNRGMVLPNAIGFMESHDEQRLMYKNLQFGNAGGDYSVKDLPVALDRMKAAGAFFFTVPGPKMIWQFGELGYEVSIDQNGRTGEKPIRWHYRSDPLRMKLYNTWAALINLRNEHEVFRSEDTQVSMSTSGAVKRMNLTHPTMMVGVIGNFDVVPHSGQTMTLPSPGWWYDFFEGDSVQVSGTTVTLDLEPGEFHIFTSERVEFPEPGLITVDVVDSHTELPGSIALHQNYPNPFNPTTVIPYSLPQTMHVRMEVFDALGRRVAVLADGLQTAGDHRLSFEADGLSTGVYMVRLTAAGTTVGKKISLVR